MRIRLLIAAGLGFLTSLPTQALDTGLTASHTAEYTTNSLLTEDDEIEEWVQSPSLNFVAAHQGPQLTLDVDYTYVRNFYQESDFENEDEAVGTANLVWNAIPNRLDLVVDHTRTQSAIRSTTALTADNLQETVNTSAGPRLRFNPRGDDELVFEYLYGNRSTTVSNTDATTHDMSASYIIAMSSTNRLTISAIKNQVQWENPADADIEYNIAQATWDKEGSAINYSFTAGYTTAERSMGLSDVKSFIYDIGIEWQARPGTDISFLAARDIRDQTYSLTTGEFASELDFGASSASAEVFISQRFGIGLTQRLGASTTLTANVISNKEDYEEGGADDDNEAIHYSLLLNRRLNERTAMSLSLNYDPLEYPDLDREDDVFNARFSIRRTLNRRLNVTFGLQYRKRESDALLASTEYDEYIGSLTVSYDLVAMRR